MKQIMNITTCEEDLLRFASRADLESFYRTYGLDGLEVLEAGTDSRGLLTPDNVIGAHLRYDSAWMDFRLGDKARLTAEFGDPETACRHFGSADPQILVERFQKNIHFFTPYAPEYLVFHVSDCTMEESMKRQYYYTDEQVIDAVIEIVNRLELPGEPWLLFENLWYPGMNMLRPEMVQRLMQGVHYGKTGIMLDVGHLLHTNPDLRTDDEAVDYIHGVLDRYEDLSLIRGIHLHQSLSGAYVRQCMETWQPTAGTYEERSWDIMQHIFAIDTHKPFRSPRIREILDRIRPDYLVWEQISADRQEHSRLLAQQYAVLNPARATV